MRVSLVFSLVIFCFVFATINALKLINQTDFGNNSNYGGLIFTYPSNNPKYFFAVFGGLSAIAEVDYETFNINRLANNRDIFILGDGYGNTQNVLQSPDRNSLYFGAFVKPNIANIVKFDLNSFSIVASVNQPCNYSMLNAWWQDDGSAVFADFVGNTYVFDVTSSPTPQLISTYATGVGKDRNTFYAEVVNQNVYLASTGVNPGVFYGFDSSNGYQLINKKKVCPGPVASGPYDFWIWRNYAYLMCQDWTVNGGTYTFRINLNDWTEDDKILKSKHGYPRVVYVLDKSETAIFLTNHGNILQYNLNDFSLVSSLAVYNDTSKFYNPITTYLSSDGNKLIFPLSEYTPVPQGTKTKIVTISLT